MLRISGPYLRTLRKLDREWQNARLKLSNVRALADTLPADHAPDLTELEQAEADARERYDKHAAQEPELSREYGDRAELAEVNADARRKEHALGLLLTAPRLATAAVAAARVTEAQSRVDIARTALADVTTRASALDAEYQAACVASENWNAIGALEERAAKLRTRVADAEASLARAERRHREALTRAEAAASAERRHVADIALARAELARVREYASTIHARLPATVSAPLREPRSEYGADVPGELHAAVRSRYAYEPATDSLHRLPHGDTVRAATVLLNGQRLSRAAVIRLLAPPSFNPEELA